MPSHNLAQVGDRALVIHGGLSRHTDLTLDDLATVNCRRQPPAELETRDDEILFDSIWCETYPIHASIRRTGATAAFQC